MKTFAEYEDARCQFDVPFPNADTLWYLALGVGGEAGELVDAVKKTFREDQGVPTEHRRSLILKEAGDVLWYLTKLLKQLDSNLGEVCQININKLKTRKKNGSLSESSKRLATR